MQTIEVYVAVHKSNKHGKWEDSYLASWKDAKEAETLQFFLDFTAAALARLVTTQDGSG